MNTLKPGTVAAVLFLMLLLAGCKDLFHSEEPEKPKEYTVTFDAAGGSPETQTRTVTEGDSLGSSGMPSAPDRDGYSFNGWYTKADSSGTPFTASTPVNADITIYAQWTAPPPGSYTVTFKLNDGTNTNWATKTVSPGAAIDTGDFPANPSRAGYTFAGWNTASNGSEAPFTASNTVSADITVYAQWTPAGPGSYTVTFKLNDGTETNWAAKTVTAPATTVTAFPANPSRPGYNFEGWNTQADGGGSEFSAGTPVTGDITVYAWWSLDTSIQYTVTFDAAGGSPATQTRTVTNGASLGSSGMPSEPTRSGYILDGWYTATDGGGSEFSAGTPVTGDITVYAWWSLDTSIQYTVTFNADGGSPAAQTRTVTNGSSLGSSGMPSEPTRAAHIFGGWYTAANGGGSEFAVGTPVTGNITVYAWWKMPDTLSLADTLMWISNNAVEGGAYTIVLKNNETISPKSLSYGGKTVGITLTGGTIERTIDLSTTGSLFTVENGVTLTLDNNVTLQGRSSNSASLVRVNSGGTLVMNTGSKISGNTSSSYSSGGGVYVSGGTFTMNSGTISSNTSYSGGGVYVSGGTFTMSGGSISGNTATTSSSSYGGGVYVSGGTFTMSGGSISGNTVTTTTSSSYGGGVYVSGGTFTMSGGSINGNTTTTSSSSYGGYGGGVYVSGGTFTKQSGGIIYGSNESDSTLKNTASYNHGHAVYVESSPAKIRNTTAGPYIVLDSTKSGAEGYWE